MSLERPLEPRFFARVAVDLAVVVELPAGPIEGRARDISEGGLGVVVAAPLHVGDELTLRVRLRATDDAPITLLAQVSWNRPEGDATRVGFEVVELSEDDAHAIRELVESHDPLYVGGVEDEPPGSLPPEVARKYVPLVRSIALSYCRKLPLSVQVDDLIGAGFVGLVEACRRHRGAYDASFQAYAEQRIRGAVLDELRALDPLSRGTRTFVRRADATGQRLAAELGRPATRAEIAERLGVTEDALDEKMSLAMASATTASLSGDEDDAAPIDVRDEQAIPVDERLEQARSFASVRVALDGLPPRLRQVLELYYGESLTLRDVGGVLGVTESRVSQLHKEAIERLRGRIRTVERTRTASRDVPLRFRREPRAVGG